MSGFNFNLVPKDVPKIKTKYRIINTAIPVPDSLKYFDSLDKYESRAMHGQLPVVWERAEDFNIYDPYGNKWIDFTSTIFVANAGHGNPKIINAIKKTLDKPLLHTYTYASKERVEYLEYLIQQTPKQFEKAFLLSAGTEATECALKLMRLKGQQTGKNKFGIITFSGNFHGRTLGAQMMNSNSEQKEWIGYHDPNIHHLPFPYPWDKEVNNDPVEFFRKSIKELAINKKFDLANDICGFVIETFQGWGAIFYPKDFIKELKKIALENNILIAFDEMQAGFGRTGKLFGYMHYEVEPDILCLGKGASSSLPLSIVLGSKEIMDLPDVGSMSSTHSANPLVCAAGKANLEVLLENGFLDNIKKLGELFYKRLNEIKNNNPEYIKYICGKGLVSALIFCDEKNEPLSHICDQVAEMAMQKGLLVVHTGRESLKLAPPLTISEEALLEGLDVLDEVISHVCGE